MSISATAKALGTVWDLTCQLALDTCRDVVYNDPAHLDGVHVIGVDEHKWSHNRAKHGAGYVTVIVDMTHHHRNSDIPARLLDVVEGRSADTLPFANRYAVWRWMDPKATPPQVKNSCLPPGE